jgi:hypothetical protein
MFSPSYIYMMEMEREGCQIFLVLVRSAIVFLIFRVCAVVEEESK